MLDLALRYIRYVCYHAARAQRLFRGVPTTCLAVYLYIVLVIIHVLFSGVFILQTVLVIYLHR